MAEQSSFFGAETGKTRRPGAKPSALRGIEEPNANAPLAARMRPRNLDSFFGQQDILKEGSVLRAAIEEDRLRSVLLFGPAGTGKTSLAHLIARATSATFVQLSAVTAGVADVRAVMEQGRASSQDGGRTILFVDEVHRFNKAQQDALLPGVEAGWVIFIGATTENPFHSVISPLLSRSLLLRLERLGDDDIAAILRRAIGDPEHGLNGRVGIDDDALAFLVAKSEGDARIALNGLESSADLATRRGSPSIQMADAEEVLRQRLVRYDREGDQHYDTVSAFIKSMRGSDPDATLAWLARMIEAGEDPRFVARRMIIFASEDVGEADPMSLSIAVAAAQALDIVGLPEARLNLAQAAVHLANAPKSNAVIRGIDEATGDTRDAGHGAVPSHLRDASYKGASTLGHGVGYKYPHAFPGARVDQNYMPEGFEGKKYWKPEEDS